MAEWVKVCLNEYRAQKGRDEARDREDAERLAMRVSMLIGERVQSVATLFGPLVAVGEGQTRLTFAFADEGRRAVGVKAHCPVCGEDYTSPVHTRADIGRIIESGCPPHADCERLSYS